MKNNSIKIFIVEDDMFYSKMLKSFLNNLGYSEVDLFHSGKDCLDNLAKNPSIIILDYTLGLDNGNEILKLIKKQNELVKVIMLSGQEYLHISVKSFKLGATDYIEKNKDSLKNVETTIRKIVEIGAELPDNEFNKKYITN